MNGRTLALFDLDGTITTHDTMFAFVRHARGNLRTALGLLWLSPVLGLHALGLVDATTAKTALLRHFFGGLPKQTLQAWAESFASPLDELVRPEARARLQWHREQGHEIVLVSASLDLWLSPWAQRQALNLLCTQAHFDGDVFTGSLQGPNCNGPEKEARIRAAHDLSSYTFVYAYGDSSGDVQMLALAHESWLRPFHPGSELLRALETRSKPAS
jgi:phosphatidylglycerophosphatase C